MRNVSTAFASAILLCACAGSSHQPQRPTLQTWMPEEYRAGGVDRSTLASDSEPHQGTQLALGSDEEATGVAASMLASERGGRRIGLSEVLELASTEGLDVLVANERVAQLEAEREIAGAAFYPRLSVGTGVYREEGRAQNTPGALFDVSKQNASLGGRLDLVFDWGDARYNVRASAHRLDASFAERDAAFGRIVRDAAWLYFDLVEANALQAISAQALETATKLVEHQVTRFENGVGLEVDLLRARSHEASMRRSVVVAGAQIEAASLRLGVLLGIDDGTGLTPVAVGLREMELVRDRDTHKLVDLALANHPEVHRTRALVLAAREEELSSKRGWLIPELVLSAGYGGLGYNYSDLNSREVYTAALEWDIGFGEFGEERRASAARKQAELQAERARREVAANVERAGLILRSAELSIEASIQEQAAAKKANELASARYANGAGLLIEVMEAELNFRRASGALVQSISAYNRGQYELLAATGGAYVGQAQ